ncbi:unnamed protein product [Rhizophagus irregularis]|nr:unnamed protein product [Rhizophagus irregularis]
MVFLFNRFRRGYRYSRKLVPAWIPIFQEIGSNVDADIPGISVPAWIPNPKDKKSAPTWTPIFQEFGSNVDADIPGISVLAWIPNPKGKSAPTWIPNPKGTKKTKIRSGGLPKNENPKSKDKDLFGWASEEQKSKDKDSFGEVSSSEEQRKIKIRLGCLGWDRTPNITKTTQIPYLSFISNVRGPGGIPKNRIPKDSFLSVLGRWIYRFGLRFLGVEYIGFGFWLLDVEYIICFDFRLGFGYMGKFPLQIFGWVSLSDFCQIAE